MLYIMATMLFSKKRLGHNHLCTQLGSHTLAHIFKSFHVLTLYIYIAIDRHASTMLESFLESSVIKRIKNKSGITGLLN